MKDTEKWMELCALAAKEQDHDKLLALTQEILRFWTKRKLALKPSLHVRGIPDNERHVADDHSAAPKLFNVVPSFWDGHWSLV
jgi:hypothetical protein